MAPNTTPVFLFSKEKKEKIVYKQEIKIIIQRSDMCVSVCVYTHISVHTCGLPTYHKECLTIFLYLFIY